MFPTLLRACCVPSTVSCPGGTAVNKGSESSTCPEGKADEEPRSKVDVMSKGNKLYGEKAEKEGQMARRKGRTFLF